MTSASRAEPLTDGEAARDDGGSYFDSASGTAVIRRNPFRLLLPLVVLLAISVALPSCRGTKKDEKPTEENRVPAFFHEIPEDTIFFLGARDPVPEEVVESIVAGAETWRKIFAELDSDALDTLDMEEVEEDDVSPFTAFIKEEFGEKITIENFEKLGFDTTPRFALYGLGTVPVFRMELADGAKLREVVERYREEFDPEWTRRDVAGVGYWEYVVPESTFDDDSVDELTVGRSSQTNPPPGGQELGGGEPDEEPSVSFTLFRITDDEIIITFVTEDTREQALPYFLGIKKPTKSLAGSNRIREIASRHGLENWFVAFFDIGTTADILEDPTVEPTSITERVLQAEDPWSDYSEACRRDTARLLAPMTVFYAGFREYTDEVTDIAIGLEMEESAAQRLSQLRSGTPGYSTDLGQDAIFMAGWGLRTGEMVGLMADIAKDIEAEPFQCEEYKRFNASSKTAARAKLNMPAWAAAIEGFSMMLTSVGFEIRQGPDGKPTEPIVKPRALAVLDTSKPEGLLFAVQTFVPEIGNLNLRPDGIPVPIPGAEGAYKGLIEPVIFMTHGGLGTSVGKDMHKPTVELLGKDEPTASPVFAMRANLGEAARVTLDELDEVVDVAAENRDARGLTEKDIAQSKKLVADLNSLFADRELVAEFTIEIDEYGALMSYRSEGAAWDIDWEEQFSGFDERFEALERVLGTYDDPAGPPQDLGNTQGTINGGPNSPGPNPPPGQSGGTGLSGTGQGGGGPDANTAGDESKPGEDDEMPEDVIKIGEMKGESSDSDAEDDEKAESDDENQKEAGE